MLSMCHLKSHLGFNLNFNVIFFLYFIDITQASVEQKWKEGVVPQGANPMKIMVYCSELM